MSGRIRVLTLTDRFGSIGGAERVATDAAAALDPERFESTLCATRWSPSDEDDRGVDAALAQLEDAGVRVIGLGRSGRLDLKAWRHLARELRSGGIDVLHAHQFGSNVWGTVVGRLARTPVIVAHEHTWSYVGQPWRKLLDRHVIARGADAFVAVSREDQRRMMEIEHIPAHVIRHIPNGVSVAARQGPRHDVREELGIPAGAPVIGTVGHLRPQKALDVLVEAAGVLRERHPDLRVLVAGFGIERERLERVIAEAGLGDVVTLLGFREDVPDVLAALDVAVQTSDYEGMPLSVLEYMEAGLPVVATRVGGVPDVVVDGETGVLVDRRDVAGFAGAVDGLLRDRHRAHVMGERGRARRRQEFDVSVMVRRFEELYVELLGRRATARAAGPSASASQSSFE